MSAAVHRLLSKNRIFDSYYTHVSLVEPRGKFSFATRNVVEDFWQSYSTAIANGETFGIAEVPQQFIPVVVDVDLKFSMDAKQPEQDKPDQYYSNAFVKRIVKAYQTVLRELVNIDHEDMLLCAWLSKPARADGEIYKNGFHLHFFNLFVDRVELETRVMPRVLQLLSDAELEPFFQAVVNREYLDKQAISNTWLLYGSVKTAGHEPYRLEQVLDCNLTEVAPEDAFARTTIYDSNCDPIVFTNYKLFLPRIFSILPAGRRVYDIQKVECPLEFINFRELAEEMEREAVTLVASREEINRDTRVAKELVRILDPERAVGHNEWMRVGWALFNITHGSQTGLEIWIQFSEQRQDHDRARCVYEWKRMKNRGTITLASLKFYARQDNPEKYVALISRLDETKRVDLSEEGMANLLVSNVQGEFVYSKHKWYGFVGHFWQQCDEGIELQRKCGMLYDMLRNLRAAENDENADPDYEKRLNKIMSRLKQKSFINSIMEWCKVKLHDQEFATKLNKNRYLIGFTNGVYDLKLNLFRKGDPNDYLSVHMPIPYEVFSPTDDQVVEVKQFFDRVFPNPNIRRYVFDIMSEIFVGYNHRKCVYFFTGSGDNGKSVTQMFFEKMLGRLSIKVPTTTLTSKKPSAGGTNEELARAGGGTRALWLEEPNADEQISEGIFKHMSGNDSFYTRGIYQNGTEIDPMFKLFIICNALPKFRHGGDKATWNRVRVVPFEATFSSNAPRDEEEQMLTKTFPKDPYLDQRIPELTTALAWMLLEHYKLPRGEDPPEVLEATKEYRGENDIYEQFVRECFIPDETAFALDLIAMEYFRSFLTSSLNSRTSAPSIIEFVKTISRYVGNLQGDRWPGYLLRPPRAVSFAEEHRAATANTRACASAGIIQGGARSFR